jgi:hypothetical protein
MVDPSGVDDQAGIRKMHVNFIPVALADVLPISTRSPAAPRTYDNANGCPDNTAHTVPVRRCPLSKLYRGTNENKEGEDASWRSPR